jgi:hypothetical protein
MGFVTKSADLEGTRNGALNSIHHHISFGRFRNFTIVNILVTLLYMKKHRG